MQPWMPNCGVRRLPLDFRDQYFGCEIELTGINRATAAQTLANLFGTRAEHSGGGYDAYRVKDLDGKEWKIVRDGSIHPECRRRSVLIGETYKVELNSPKLECTSIFACIISTYFNAFNASTFFTLIFVFANIKFTSDNFFN